MSVPPTRRSPVRLSRPAAMIGAAARTAAVAMAVALLALTGCSSDNTSEAVNDTPTTVVTEPTTTTSTTEAPIDDGQVVYVYSPTVGDCFDRRRVEPEQGGPRIILLLDCGLPHAFEVLGVFEFDTSVLQPLQGTAPSYPGEDQLAANARLRCPPLFAQWVGKPYELSELELSWLLPSPENWANGDRTIGCTIFDPSTERTTGTTRDSQS